ncbi:MAG: STAS domain-containing protein, partial [Eubacteriales bacterium]|nr:STAS domain-containing protein [Eubacteriales bacterium]
MIINANRQDDILIVTPEGRLDTLSAPELEEFLDKYYASVSEIIFNFEKLDYVSSAGLRVLLR